MAKKTGDASKASRSVEETLTETERTRIDRAHNDSEDEGAEVDDAEDDGDESTDEDE